jgi:hypothetical protein
MLLDSEHHFIALLDAEGVTNILRNRDLTF